MLKGLVVDLVASKDALISEPQGYPRNNQTCSVRRPRSLVRRDEYARLSLTSTVKRCSDTTTKIKRARKACGVDKSRGLVTMGPKKVSVVFEFCDQDALPFLRTSHASCAIISEAVSCQNTMYFKIRAFEDKIMLFQRPSARFDVVSYRACRSETAQLGHSQNSVDSTQNVSLIH